ncbi:MAG: NAD(P)H-quinone oxidoreductase subunit F [Cyanobacteriota bacterium]|nr:NAD(P)H-quinone oxidoreductase subunit F [Cyanobacteriota bacterium]
MPHFLLDTSWWIPCYGLIGAFLTLPWAIGLIRQTGPRPAAYLNILATLLALGHSLVLLIQIWPEPPSSVVIPWLHIVDLRLDWVLEVSPVSVGASVLITSLSLLAQIYALGYLEKDWGLARFYALMGFFEGAMSGIAISDSLFLSYALLEMLTLSTYLLVGFWYAQPLVVKAARDAFLTKRVGDLLLLMGVVGLATLAGSLNFSDLAAWAATADLAPWLATLLGLALIAGPTGKCAQFPLHLWLDEAMEGPNPASILRNSVVVACGAYVLIKLQPVLVLSPTVSVVLMALGSLTAVGSSLVSIAQIDIKRTLSHSTSAYLGLVFVAVGLQQPQIALVFLFAHALAKALLFMGVGSIISTIITQDLTEMGGLRSRMPATTTAFAVGSAAMISFLPLGGFWGMVHLAQVFMGAQPWLMGVLLGVNGLTAFNLTRIFGLIFQGKPQPKTRRAPEVPWPMAVPMVFMAVMNLLMPLLLATWHLLPIWTPSTQQSALLLVASSGLGMMVGIRLYWATERPQPVKLAWRQLQNLFAYDFYVERFYQQIVVVPFALGSKLSTWFDRYWVDGVVNGVSLAFLAGGESLKYTVSGRMQLYLLTIVMAVVVAGAWLILRPLS